MSRIEPTLQQGLPIVSSGSAAQTIGVDWSMKHETSYQAQVLYVISSVFSVARVGWSTEDLRSKAGQKQNLWNSIVLQYFSAVRGKKHIIA